MKVSLAILAVVSCLAGAGATFAQDLPTMREARDQVFARDGALSWEVIGHDSLNPAELQLLEQIIPLGALPQMAYYGALAIAPDQGLADPDTTAAVGNYHSEEGARAAALAACNAARSGGSDCAVVLVVRPEGWEAGRSLQLNADATASLWGAFRQLGRPRAMAISQATGIWGIGASPQEALAACAADGAAQDCATVVAEE